MLRKLNRVIAIGLVVATSLAGCSYSPDMDTSQSSQSPQAGAIIRANNVEPVSDLIPSKVTDTAGWKVVTQLFDGLVTFSPQGDLVYANAQSIVPNQDATTFTIKLKKGLKFSNGEQNTASTYARAWSFAANAANGQTGGALFSIIDGYDKLQNPHGSPDALLQGLTVVDDQTLQVRLSAPDSSFVYKVGDVSFLPLPSVAYEDMKAYGRKPIGNGPYKFESWTPNQSIRLQKDPNYQGARKASNAGITFVDYQSLDSAYADLEAGNLDVLDAVPVSSLATYRDDKLIQAFSKPSPSCKSLTIPSKLAHFKGDEGTLRRAAISHSINCREISQKVFRNTVIPATDFAAPTIAGYSQDLKGTQVLDYNQREARQLWKQADTISAWSGSFEIAYSADGTDKEWVDALTHSIHETLGIHATSNVFPTGKEFKTAINQRQIHSAFSSGHQSDYPHLEGYLVEGYSSAAADGKGLNYGDYKNPAFDQIIAQAAQQTQQAQSLGYYQQAEQVLLHDLPAIPLWYIKTSAATSKHVTDVAFNYMGLPSYYHIRK
ncbi:peptide ABC transporter substrate-binding protein [Bombiscardovia coagulans]|uniref:ABC transporter n=1 Tax=Bombiscardovia coagulans TaxID=686666 RepID=A0A261ETM4_9BIFI|nr:ABC transporter substrate-binding protein [Bombiscardovia coagulans]OZG50208.1 ABC transporter [Bombiscardovia coagulans]